MAMFVHLTSAANAPRIRRPRGRPRTAGRAVCNCFPVLPSHTLIRQ
ncbi:hypothetical protein [Streptomyces sp. ID05-04B]|nr:hypothetical protein [Streptomyces sp. ID05-04B]